MSDRAHLFAQLVTDLAADLPFSADALEARLGVDLERMDHSNAFFTVYSGSVTDSATGVSQVEVREPTLQSLQSGKNGLIVLRFSDGLHRDDVTPHMPDLSPLPVDPFSVPSDGSVLLQAEYPWGSMVLTVDGGTGMVRVAMLDTIG